MKRKTLVRAPHILIWFGVLIICISSAVLATADTNQIAGSTENEKEKSINSRTSEEKKSSSIIELNQEELAWLAKNLTIRVRVTDFPPYIIPQTDGEPDGIAVDYLKLIAERTGIKLKYSSSGKPFSEALDGLKKHQGPDLILTIVSTPDRQKSVLFSKDYLKSPYVIFMRAYNKKIISGMSDILGKKVALQKGSALHKIVESDYPDINLMLFDYDIQALEAVANKKADAYIGNLTLGSYHILKKGLYNLKIAAPSPFGEQIFSVGIRNDWPELNGIIDKGLAAITLQEQAEIRNKYISIRYETADTNIVAKWVLLVIASAFIIILFFTFWNRSLKKQVAERAIELKSREEQYRDLFENMVQGAFYQSIDGELKDVNSAALEMFGLSYDQFIGKTSKDPQWRVIHEDGTDFPGEEHPSMVSLQTGRECRDIVAGIYNVNKKDYTWVSINAVPQFKKNEMQPYQVFVTMHDITARKHSEDLLQKSEKEFRSTLNNLLIGVVVYAGDTSILFSNPEAAKIFGLTHDQMSGKETVDPAWCFVNENLSVMLPEDYPVSKVLSTKKPMHDSVYGIIRPDRKDITWVIVNAIPVFSIAGDVEKVIVNFIDYTDRKRAEEQLRRNESLLNTTQQLAKIGGWEIDLEKQITYWTDEVYRIHDLEVDNFSSIDEAVKLSLNCYNSEDKLLVLDAFRKCTEEGLAYDLEFPFTTTKGRCIWVRVTASPVMKGDTIVKVIGTIIDITERKKLEEERMKLESKLRQSQKMESIGTLAGGIAHDFNNILFPIVGHAEMLLEDVPEDSVLCESLKEIFTGAMRARELVKQILTFSRQESQGLKVLKIQPVVIEALRLIRSTIPTTIKISQDIRSDCGLIKADPTHIHQIVMNLATNAYHAMEESGGNLTVNLKEITFSEHDVANLDIEPGTYVCLTMADTGIGMDKYTTEKAFDPFFTTKKLGKGTGMGLSVIHGIVKNAGGDINVYSEIGKGTEFRVYLPVVKSLSEQHELQTKEVIQGGVEQILIVDDEDPILNMEKQMLERLGYQVVPCNNGLEALAMFCETPDKFDMVITDMAMPNMSGDKLATELIKIRPDIPILLCTGFSEHIPEDKALSMGVKGFLMKPIVRSDLSSKIREILDA